MEEKRTIDSKLGEICDNLETSIAKIKDKDVRESLQSIYNDLNELKKDINWVVLLRHIYKKKLLDERNNI